MFRDKWRDGALGAACGDLDDEPGSGPHGVGLGLYAEEMAYGSSLTRKLIRQQDARLRPAGYELIKPSDGSQESAVSYAYDFASRLNHIHPSDSFPASPDFTYTYLSSRPSLNHNKTEK